MSASIQFSHARIISNIAISLRKLTSNKWLLWQLNCHLCDMVVDSHGCIRLGVAWCKVPRKLDIPYQPIQQTKKILVSEMFSITVIIIASVTDCSWYSVEEWRAAVESTLWWEVQKAIHLLLFIKSYNGSGFKVSKGFVNMRWFCCFH